MARKKKRKSTKELGGLGTVISPSWTPDWIKLVLETEKEKGRPICGCKNSRSLPCNKHPGENGRCHWHGGKSTGPKTEEGKQTVAQNALKTGEHQQILFDTLDDDELLLIEQVTDDVLEELLKELKLVTVRERRMLKRIEDLKACGDYTIVKRSVGIEKGKATDIAEEQGVLGQIQSIEEALTRVQAHKRALIEAIHKVKLDGGPGEDALERIQNFIQATRMTPEEGTALFESDEDNPIEDEAHGEKD